MLKLQLPGYAHDQQGRPGPDGTSSRRGSQGGEEEAVHGDPLAKHQVARDIIERYSDPLA